MKVKEIASRIGVKPGVMVYLVTKLKAEGKIQGRNAKIERDDEKVKQLWEKGLTAQEIAQQIGCLPGYIYGVICRLRKQGKPVTRRRNKPSLDYERVQQLWLAGLGAKDIATQVGSTTKDIFVLISKLRRKGQLPDEHRRRKRTNRQQFIQLWQKGKQPKEIAQMLKLTLPDVYMRAYYMRKAGIPVNFAPLKQEQVVRLQKKILLQRRKIPYGRAIRLWNARVPVKDIAQQVGTTPKYLYKLISQLKRAGITVYPRWKRVPNQVAKEIVKEYRQGKKKQELAEKYGFSLNIIAYICYKKSRLASTFRRKIPEHAAKKILKEYRQGKKRSELAQKYGFTLNTIDFICYKKFRPRME